MLAAMAPTWVPSSPLPTPAKQGELDVIADLITFVEQQQFLAVEGIHRHPPSLQERVRARALRLAASQAQLRGACALLQRGLTSLQVRPLARCCGQGGGECEEGRGWAGQRARRNTHGLL